MYYLYKWSLCLAIFIDIPDMISYHIYEYLLKTVFSNTLLNFNILENRYFQLNHIYLKQLKLFRV